MAIKLLVSCFNHPINTLVSDLSYDIEKRLVAKSIATYTLSGGTAQTFKTVPNNLSEFEQNLLIPSNSIDVNDGSLLPNYLGAMTYAQAVIAAATASNYSTVRITDRSNSLYYILNGAVNAESSGAAAVSAYGTVYLDNPTYAADPTGVSDSSAAIVAAIAALPASGGAVIFGAGTYLAQDIRVQNNVFFIGQGVGITILKLLASPSNHLFRSTISGTLSSGGIIGMSLLSETYGSSKSVYNGIDLASCSDVTGTFRIALCEAAYFCCGVRGSANDNDIDVLSCKFSYNTVGYYVKGNHPQFSGINYFYNNTYGLAGGLYDCNIIGIKSYSNAYGITSLADDGRPGTGVSTISAGGNGVSNVLIANSMFSNTILDIFANDRVTIANNKFLVNASQTKPNAIKICGNNTKVKGNTFRDDGLYPVTDAAISLIDNPSSSLLVGIEIEGNNIDYSAAACGGLVKNNCSSGHHVRSMKCEGNIGTTTNGGFLYSTNLSSGSGLYLSNISHNEFDVKSGGTSQDIIYVPTGGNRLGNKYDGNILSYSTAGGRYHMNVTVTESSIHNNVCLSLYTNVTSITHVTTTATVTLAGHGYSTGDIVYMAGSPQAPYNGQFTITVINSSTFTYTMGSDPGIDSTGTPRTSKQGIFVDQTNGAGYYGCNTATLRGSRDAYGNLVMV